MGGLKVQNFSSEEFWSVFALDQKSWFVKYHGDCYTISTWLMISSDLKLISTLQRDLAMSLYDLVADVKVQTQNM